MSEQKLQLLRLIPFFGVLSVMAVFEIFFPRRQLTLSKTRRWITNLGVVFVDTVTVRVFVPVSILHVALWAEGRGIGLLNSIPHLSYGVRFVLAMVALDFIIYLQHVMFHAVPLLWRLHMVHHADMDYDVTTGLRFHPIEIVISVGIKVASVVLLGAPAMAVFVFEVVLNACAMFNHSNVHIPKKVDRVLRWFLVTPDMHRVHHSVFANETNSNFGFNLPYWDRIMGTYTAQPRGGHEQMKIGLMQFRNPKVASLIWLLAAPFYERTGHYAINAMSED